MIAATGMSPNCSPPSSAFVPCSTNCKPANRARGLRRRLILAISTKPTWCARSIDLRASRHREYLRSAGCCLLRWCNPQPKSCGPHVGFVQDELTVRG